MIFGLWIEFSIVFTKSLLNRIIIVQPLLRMTYSRLRNVSLSQLWLVCILSLKVVLEPIVTSLLAIRIYLS